MLSRKKLKENTQAQQLQQEIATDLTIMLRKSQFKQLTFRKYANFNVLGALFWVQKESLTVIRFKRTYKILPSKVALK